MKIHENAHQVLGKCNWIFHTLVMVLISQRVDGWSKYFKVNVGLMLSSVLQKGLIEEKMCLQPNIIRSTVSWV